MIVEHKITEIGWQIYDCIKASADGLTRREIALALGKRWNVWDTTQIERLISLNLVAVEMKATGMSHMSEYVYRVTESQE